jgi:hypothetical protein
MDRDRLRAFLKDPGTTWRWNRGEADGYRAVELRGDTLRWFTWSHDIAEGAGGETDVHTQSVSAFLSGGAPTDAPEHVVATVKAHLEQRDG